MTEEVLIAQKFPRSANFQSFDIRTKSGADRGGEVGNTGSIYATLIANYSFYFKTPVEK